MALPPAASDRQLHHRRSLDVQVYRRRDGLWDVDARLSDVRSDEVMLAHGMLPAGEPIHHMLLRLVVDSSFNVLEAGAETLSMPYAGACDRHGDAYGQLVGLNLMRGFRHAVLERLGGVRGCTHITELSQVLPTAVVQAFAGTVIDTRGHDADSARPFQIDRCQALRADGETVRTHYPRWYRPTATPGTDPEMPLADAGQARPDDARLPPAATARPSRT